MLLIVCCGYTVECICSVDYCVDGSAGFLDLLMMKSNAAVAMSLAVFCASDCS